MKIQVLQLVDGKQETISHEYDAAHFDVGYDDMRYTSNIVLKGTAERNLTAFTFRGRVGGNIEQTCARCLRVVPSKTDEAVLLTYDVSDVETVDLTNDLRDILLLAHHDRFLCRSNCKGLCPKCGTNLNQGRCQCATEADHKPFSGLKNLLKNKTKE